MPPGGSVRPSFWGEIVAEARLIVKNDPIAESYIRREVVHLLGGGKDYHLNYHITQDYGDILVKVALPVQPKQEELEQVCADLGVEIRSWNAEQISLSLQPAGTLKCCFTKHIRIVVFRNATGIELSLRTHCDLYEQGQISENLLVLSRSVAETLLNIRFPNDAQGGELSILPDNIGQLSPVSIGDVGSSEQGQPLSPEDESSEKGLQVALTSPREMLREHRELPQQPPLNLKAYFVVSLVLLFCVGNSIDHFPLLAAGALGIYLINCLIFVARRPFIRPQSWLWSEPHAEQLEKPSSRER